MKKKILIIGISALFFSLALMPSINANVSFVKTQLKSTGMTGDLKSEAYSIKQTKDGGYITTGWIGEGFSMNYYYWYNTSIYVVKTDSDGKMIWEKTFGPGIGISVHNTEDTGYLICANTQKPDVQTHMMLIKLDANGNKQWDKMLKGGQTVYYCGAMETTNDGQYIITGFVDDADYDGHTGMFLMKINNKGDILWEQTYNYENAEHTMKYYTTSTAVQQTSDGGYIITGFNESDMYGSDAILYKTDGDGNVEWTRVVRENIGSFIWDHSLDVKETTDRGFIFTGCREGYGNTRLWLIKTNSQGENMWNYTYPDASEGKSVLETRDGGYIVAGADKSGSGILIKTDSQGTIKQHTDLGVGNIKCMQQTSDSGYILAGSSNAGAGCNNRLWIVKIDDNYLEVWSKIYDGNQPPNTPEIDGPTSGKIHIPYTYNIIVSDPDKDDLVELEVNFGDGEVVTIVGEWSSGEKIEIEHTWTKTGDFEIQVRVKDVVDTWSDWGTLSVSMLRNKLVINQWLKVLLEKMDFPFFTKLLNL